MAEKLLETWEKVINPNYISAEIIGGENCERVVTIEKFTEEDVMNYKTNKSEIKPVAHFTDAKPLILNKTNSKQLRKMFPDKEPNEIVGETIILYVIKGNFFGKEQYAVRIKENPTIACENCGTPIEPSNNRTAAEMINYSKKHCNGKTLCLACMKQLASKQKEAK